MSDQLRPYGVNLGGWFCLEDWFYSLSSGPHAGHCVATPNPDYDEASCRLSTEGFVGDVRTIFPGLTGEEQRQLVRSSFGCETDLVNLLLQSGLTETRILELFAQHRRRYVMPLDFARLRALGVRRARLPVTWCISYDTPYLIRGRDQDGNDTSATVTPGPGIVEDPFTNDAAFDSKTLGHATDKWVVIPVEALEEVLETAADHGIEVLLDVHAFPGGSSAGTFNGVWPHNPCFWSAHHEENFKTIVCKLLDWMESLRSKRPKAFRSLYGLSPMNEPAHLRGLFDPKGAGVKVPYEAAYSGGNWASKVSTETMLSTLALSVSLFRERPLLIGAEMKLVMNIIETAFNGTFGGEEDAGAFAASQRGETDAVASKIGSWWKSVTSKEERTTWAILDIHNYIAWNPDVVKFRSMASMEEHSKLIEEMSLPFFRKLRERLGMPKPDRLACSEFSASTDQDTFLSVTSGVGRRPPSFPHFNWQEVRDNFLRLQNETARRADIDMWFWTYHIRYNVNYQGEWSLQHILSPWPRLRRSLASSPLALQTMLGAGGCLLHAVKVASCLALACLKAPVRGLWLQALGLRFHFGAAR
eukprot:TRINITY_DN32483_c0_g1_i1.p1 TRINITY_DN32483_c0_g1~~TRINITY_DN32483_c0_g1_i1.p1  ORF type:complete len:586 (+),score=127.90 TRINITY_DN32483_c0_g1_i1:44-1801(+)